MGQRLRGRDREGLKKEQGSFSACLSRRTNGGQSGQGGGGRATYKAWHNMQRRCCWENKIRLS